jgi:diguanylate cyclase (GGDEF)-like protein
VCIPVSVMGRTVGVIHAVHPVDAPLDEHGIDDLQAVANQAGTRLGMLRVMAETQLQAATDGLTGLLNRRAFENAFLDLRSRSDQGAVIAMADLDHFKAINDTYGHETGDRALRTFAETLRRALRPTDVLSRRGGEEFAVAFPECDLETAVQVLEGVRVQLRAAIREAGLPSFTVSFGVTPAVVAEDLDLLLGRADAALFDAKRAGRDRVVVYGAVPAQLLELTPVDAPADSAMDSAMDAAMEIAPR